MPSTGPERCCTTWVSSWASIVRPAVEDGSYFSRWKTTLEPTVYAWAFTEAADRLAASSVCTRTSEKS